MNAFLSFKSLAYFAGPKLESIKISMKRISTILLCVVAVILTANAQIQTPQASAAGSVTSIVGLTEIKIDYFRPKMKGRKIFGDGAGFLIPYGAIWRSGANSGTKITFSDDVKVGGVAVPKGQYLLLTWPGATEWTVALNKDVSLGGNTGGYDAAKDAAKFKVTPSRLSEPVETLTYNISDISDDSKTANIQLAWENTSVKIRVETEYDAKVMSSIEANTKVNPNNYFQAAVYYLENGKDLNKALEWVNIALQSNPTAFWMLHQKARIQKALGDKKGATETATASLNSAKEAKNRDYQTMNETLIKEMK
jgi:hypothetical protein